MMQLNTIRNFSIIAHIDHGKTTLTDRILEVTGAVEKRKMHERFLDFHPIAQERGVTIKLAPVKIDYSPNTKHYSLNLIDTPGHIDFSYEVERSLKCCEGAVLLVDATQGIQAQTLANFNLAKKLNLAMIPVINKIDLSNARPEKTLIEMVESFGFEKDEFLYISAKEGKGVGKLLDAVVERIPPPVGKSDDLLRALVFDSFYHQHKGIVVYVRIVDGKIDFEKNRKLRLMGSGKEFEAMEIGYLKPHLEKASVLDTGEVGYIATGLKDIDMCRVGDTVTISKTPKLKNSKTQKKEVGPLEGYRRPKAVVFFDFYPVENEDFNILKQALEEIKLNDYALEFETTGIPALGKGFRIGFLGVFHAEITQEKIERDYGLDIVITSPSVEYEVEHKDGKVEKIKNAAEITEERGTISKIREPWVKVEIYAPKKYLGEIFKLCEASRGKFEDQKYFGSYVEIEYQLPLVELISGFYNKLKSASSGFASLNYRFIGFRNFDWAVLEILINKQEVEALSFIIEKGKGKREAKRIAKKLKEVIPAQLFEVPIQVSLNGNIVARETIKALRKDVTAKLYGGDQTRKDKLLKKQKKGKKRMKAVGEVNIPQEAFLSVLGE